MKPRKPTSLSPNSDIIMLTLAPLLTVILILILILVGIISLLIIVITIPSISILS